MNTNYIEELNESQCAAVTYNDGPSLVIAGAGFFMESKKMERIAIRYNV